MRKPAPVFKGVCGAVFFGLICALAPVLPAGFSAQGETIPKLKAVPAELTPRLALRLAELRRGLVSELSAFQKDAQQFNSLPAENQAVSEFESLKQRRSAYIEKAKAFNKDVEETERRLRDLYPKLGREATIARLAELDQAIPKIHKEIEKNPADWSHFAARYDEWLKLDQDAAQEARAAAVDFVISYFFAVLKVKAKERIDWDSKRIWDAFNQSPLAKADFQKLNSGMAANSQLARSFSAADNFVEFIQNLRTGWGTGRAIQREEYGRAIINLLGFALKDPRVSIAVAGIEIMAASFVANATDAFARQEIDRVLDNQTEALKNMTTLHKKMESLVDERIVRRKDLEAMR